MQNHKVKKARLGSTGSKHWNYRHGQETLAAKQERSEQSFQLQQLEDAMHLLGMTTAKRSRGRKANGYYKIKSFDNVEKLLNSK